MASRHAYHRATCEDVGESCRVVLQELNRILDVNEQDGPEDSSGSDSAGSLFLLTYFFYLHSNFPTLLMISNLMCFNPKQINLHPHKVDRL
jgi:hypothetical protein